MEASPLQLKIKIMKKYSHLGITYYYVYVLVVSRPSIAIIVYMDGRDLYSFT